MSDLSQSAEIVESAPQVEPSDVESEKVETVEQKETTEQPEEENDNDDSLPKGVKKRLDKLTRQKYEAQAEINRMRSELEQLKAQTQPEIKEPDIADYSSAEDWVNAQVEYRLQKMQMDEQQKYNQQSEAQAIANDWQSKTAKFKAVAPDFDDKFAIVSNIEFAPSTIAEVAKHEKGAEIAYMLGQNPSEAYRIASLPPMQQLMAIGEIAASAKFNKPKQTTSAPKPAPTVNGSSPSLDYSNMPTDQFIKMRNKQKTTKR
jgi:hypothetical protein